MEERQGNTLHNHTRILNEWPRVTATTPPSNEWNKVRKLALRHLNRFVSLEPKVLKGDDPDAIHDMRVASRRLQQVLDLIFPNPLPREVRRLRRKIRRCRQALGEVRNCDVLLQQVGGRLARPRCSNREAWIVVKQHLQERRSESFAKAIRKLSKVNLAVLYMRTKGLLDRLKPIAENTQVSHPLGQPNVVDSEPFPQRLAQALVGVWSEFEQQVTASHRENTPASIHAARIGAKRLRYLLEVETQFAIPGSAGALAWLKKIQECLGDWHDMEVLEEMTIEMISKPEFLRDQLPLALATGKLIMRNRSIKQGFRDKYFSMTLHPTSHQELKIWAEDLLAAPASAKA
jgi:CHAD domain-containing protein